MIPNRILAILLATAFLLIGIFTLPHYGINWDTINHLPRGQAYLHYFLAGKKDFSDLPEWRLYWQKADTLSIRSDIAEDEIPSRSLYQSNATTFLWFLQNDGGHPPLSDILSSFFNLILFQKLRVINDIDSYRVYGVFLAALLIGLVFWWASSVYGRFAGIVAAISLGTYPLFWSELHFNTEKDIPEMVYWSFVLFAVSRGVIKKDWRWLLGGGVFFGFALGTKFNILFFPFVFLPWLFVVLILRCTSSKRSFSLKSLVVNNIKVLLFLSFIPLIGLVIFIATWPYLWADPLSRIYNVFEFYKDIGLTKDFDSRFLGPFNLNTYPIKWIIYTTPPLALILFLLGVLTAMCRLKQERDKISLLFLLWLVVPIARVTWPGATIYGGVRQVMEYIPALAILAGLGGWVLREWLVRVHFGLQISKKVASVLVIAFFSSVILQLVRIHPNENVYFNFLIDGLKGAKQNNFPSWGNTFGAAYRQGVNWINENAEYGANVVLAYELHPNIPRIFFRTDLTVSNKERSGYLRRGEYAITLIYEGTAQRSYYDMYLEKFIEPVYVVSVDGIAILKVWKNDQQHLKSTWKEGLIDDVLVENKSSGIEFDLGRLVELARLEIEYAELSCEPISSGYVYISRDGNKWEQLPGKLPVNWRIAYLGEQPRDGKFLEPFVGQDARYIRLVLHPEDICLKNIKSFEVYIFE